MSVKYCPSCKQDKDLMLFTSDNSVTGFARSNVVCNKCRYISAKDTYDEYLKTEKAKRRAKVIKELANGTRIKCKKCNKNVNIKFFSQKHTGTCDSCIAFIKKYHSEQRDIKEAYETKKIIRETNRAMSAEEKRDRENSQQDMVAEFLKK